MSFASLSFLAIAASSVVLYYIVPKAYRWYVLLLVSVFFYAYSAGLAALLVAILTAAFTWAAALQMEKIGDDRRKRRLHLYVGVVIVLGLLVLFKLKRHFAPDVSFLIVPLGVSYYSLSLIGYLVDVFYKKAAAERSLPRMILYTLYYPKIVQGPISKFRELGPKLIEGHSFDDRNLCFGLQRMLWGYFKKLVIADRVAVLVSAVFDRLPYYREGGAVLIVVTFFAVVRHYCDFSGYMDIVIGLSQMMGVELDENFQQPFYSRSAAEFWRRWHMSLGTWFKDYVYMPLVIHPKVISLSGKVRKRFGKRPGKAVLTIIPLAVVWLLTGLWHGTGWDYMIWGVYWGTIIILSNVFAPEIKKLTSLLHIRTDAADWHAFQTLRTFGIFTFGLLISTFVGCRQLPLYFKIILRKPLISRMFVWDVYTSLGVPAGGMALMLVSTAVLLIVEYFQQKGSIRERVAALHAPVRWSIYGMLIVAVLLFGFGFGGVNGLRDFGYAFF